jgi:Mg2+/Co2+ transporter CorB
LKAARTSRELNKAFNWHLPADGPRTINGMLLEVLEDIPTIGTSLRIEDYEVEILDVQDNMIKQVQVRPLQPLQTSVNQR